MHGLSHHSSSDQAAVLYMHILSQLPERECVVLQSAEHVVALHLMAALQGLRRESEFLSPQQVSCMPPRASFCQRAQ